jgi:hypothetical protein
VETADSTNFQHLALPTFERLSRSLLKMACLLAATRQKPDNGMISCAVEDIEQAARYIQVWGNHTIDLLQKAGRSTHEKQLQTILARIQKEPNVMRSTLMRLYHIRAREMQEIQQTLEERGQIIVRKTGRTITFTAI